MAFYLAERAKSVRTMLNGVVILLESLAYRQSV